MSGVITSFGNPTVKALTGLHLRKNRQQSGLFLVEGLRHVHDALRHGWVLDTLVHAGKVPDDVRRAAGRVLEVSEAILEKISRKDNPQNLIAAFKQRAPQDVTPTQDGCWVALEGVRDSGNLGTIIRTVHGAGAAGVILVGACCDLYAPEVVRASMGSVFAVPVASMEIDDFKGLVAGWQGSVVGTALEGAQDFRQIQYKAPVLLIMGTEQSGLSDSLRGALPQMAKLPMRDGVDSLNLAISTGVMLYAVLAPWGDAQ